MNALDIFFRNPRYAYDRQADGCDDLWEIYDRQTHKTIASIVFWDCDPEWMARTEQRAQRWVARLNRRRPLLSGHGRLP